MKMIKITFMGAGSTVFAKNVLGDVMMTPSLWDSEIALYDIDPARLEESYIMICSLNKNINENRATVKKYLGVAERKDALRDATFVVDAIQVGGYDPCTIIDFEVPKKYGLRQTIADTLGIGGIFRALSIPFPFSMISHVIWLRSAPRLSSSTIPTPWRSLRAICRDIPPSRP